jgi:SAM-dependent methyltransferase
MISILEQQVHVPEPVREAAERRRILASTTVIPHAVVFGPGAPHPSAIAPDDTEAEEDLALTELGRALRARDYRFVTISPASHARVVGRSSGRPGSSLRDVFGWNLPFRRSELEMEIEGHLRHSGRFVQEGEFWRSTVRFSSLGPLLLVHSAYPTDSAQSVFLGPDTYRFCELLERAVPSRGTVVDVGCGTGAGGLFVAPRIERLILSDVNPLALRFARVNCALAGRPQTEVLVSDVLSGVEGPVDAVLANPPYLVDASERTYRHGGRRGIELSERIVHQAIEKVGPAGRLVLYTGSPVVEGRDLLREALESVLRARCTWFEYRELDPDVWGEELDTPAYRDAERIALVSLVAEVQ